MALLKTTLAGAVVALTAALAPQAGQARMGPVGPLAETAGVTAHQAAPVEKAGHRHGYRRAGASFSFGFSTGGYGYGYPAYGYPSYGWGYGYPRYRYVAPPVVIYRPAPRRRHYRAGYYEPWSSEWLAYCSSKYRTFDPRTGYYFYKRGKQRFCR